MAGLIEAVPQITWLGKNKALVFGIAGVLLLVSGAWQWHARSLPCPADKAQAVACARARKVSWIVWGLSVALYAIGFFFPVVPRGQARIRVQLSAAHTTAQLDAAVAAFALAGRELGLVQ